MVQVQSKSWARQAWARQAGATLCGPALALVMTGVMGGPAVAGEPLRISVGGFMEQWIGFAANKDVAGGSSSNGRDYANFDSQSDTEIHFLGQTTLDNGITVGITVELEGDRNATGQDLTFMHWTSPQLGLLQLGSVDNSVKQTHSASPEVGITNMNGDYNDWVATPSNFTDITTSYFDADTKVNKINFISPMHKGFQWIGTYTPDAQDNVQQIRTGGSSAYTLGLLYRTKRGDWMISLDGAYSKINPAPGSSERVATTIGAKASNGTWAIGGGAVIMDDDSLATTASQKGYAFDVGASYTVGKYRTSLSWFTSSAEGSIDNNKNDRKNSVMLSGGYTLSPGIDLLASLFYVDFEGETATAADNNSGYGGVGGVKVTF